VPVVSDRTAQGWLPYLPVNTRVIYKLKLRARPYPTKILQGKQVAEILSPRLTDWGRYSEFLEHRHHEIV